MYAYSLLSVSVDVLRWTEKIAGVKKIKRTAATTNISFLSHSSRRAYCENIDFRRNIKQQQFVFCVNGTQRNQTVESSN